MVAGAMHFVYPEAYVRIVPPILPRPQWLVAVSGACEIAGGAGLLFRLTRRCAAIGLAMLLIAVFPANLYMAREGVRPLDMAIPTWALWARLPLQLPLIWWALRYARKNAQQERSSG